MNKKKEIDQGPSGWIASRKISRVVVTWRRRALERNDWRKFLM